ncbi:MAG: hypothetical protein IPG22_06360 [Acidobacteria bacterium]|nr:hypothetical protein [Acidobacteriota bacterium]
MIPTWLYNFLPKAYIAGGLAAMYLIDNKLGTASGALLLVTGLIVVLLRRSLRLSPRRDYYGD